MVFCETEYDFFLRDHFFFLSFLFFSHWLLDLTRGYAGLLGVKGFGKVFSNFFIAKIVGYKLVIYNYITSCKTGETLITVSIVSNKRVSQNLRQTGSVELQKLVQGPFRTALNGTPEQRNATDGVTNGCKRCCINAALLMLNRQPGNYMQIAAATV